MLSNKKREQRAVAAVIGALSVAASSLAYAHTGISSLPVAPKDGQGAYLTALTITHGCGASKEGEPPAPQKPVAAASVVFPNSPASVATKLNLNSDGSTASSEPITDLSEFIEGTTGTGLTGLSPALIQDGSVWAKNSEIIDAAGTVRGFKWTDGRMKPKLYAYPPFRIAIPKIKASSCVAELRIRAAVGNYCTTSTNVNADDRADIWFGHLTPLFNDVDVQPEGYYPQLIVKRDGTLPTQCGNGFAVAVEPADADVDQYLPVSGYWPAK